MRCRPPTKKKKTLPLTSVQDEVSIQGSEVKIAAGSLHSLAPQLSQALAALVHHDHLEKRGAHKVQDQAKRPFVTNGGCCVCSPKHQPRGQS